MKETLNAGPSLQERLARNLKKLQTDYKRDPNVADSKYGISYFMKVWTEFSLIPVENSVMRRPEVVSRLQSVKKAIEEMKERQPFSATEEEIDNVETLLNEAIPILENKL